MEISLAAKPCTHVDARWIHMFKWQLHRRLDSAVCGGLRIVQHVDFPPEVAGVTFSDSDSAPVPKFLNPGPDPVATIFLIWESDSCSDYGYNHRSNRNLPMFYLTNDNTDSCYCRNWKATPDPGPVFHKFLTLGPKERCKILPESNPAIRIQYHLCFPLAFAHSSQVPLLCMSTSTLVPLQTRPSRAFSLDLASRRSRSVTFTVSCLKISRSELALAIKWTGVSGSVDCCFVTSRIVASWRHGSHLALPLPAGDICNTIWQLWAVCSESCRVFIHSSDFWSLGTCRSSCRTDNDMTTLFTCVLRSREPTNNVACTVHPCDAWQAGAQSMACGFRRWRLEKSQQWSTAWTVCSIVSPHLARRFNITLSQHRAQHMLWGERHAYHIFQRQRSIIAAFKHSLQRWVWPQRTVPNCSC